MSQSADRLAAVRNIERSWAERLVLGVEVGLDIAAVGTEKRTLPCAPAGVLWDGGLDWGGAAGSVDMAAAACSLSFFVSGTQ